MKPSKAKPKASKPNQFHPLRLNYSAGSPFATTLRVKALDPKGIEEPTYPVQCALLVVGLPAGFEELQLQETFECIGDVSKVLLHPSKTSGIVVFAGEQGVAAALATCREGKTLSAPQELDSIEPEGLKHWVEEHKAERPGNDILQAQLDDWIARYEAEEARKQREREAAMAGDGWTVVVRSKGRKRTREEDGVTVTTGGVSTTAAAASNAEKAPVVHEDFYKFQKRDKRRNEVLELQKKFAAGKQRIAELRAARKFRPF